jgi:hypothetical protein
MTNGGHGPVSAVVISFDEERKIGACLESLRWAA